MSADFYVQNSNLKWVNGSIKSALGVDEGSLTAGNVYIDNIPLGFYYGDSSNNKRRLKGIDVGPTTEDDGSIWVSSARNSLVYAYSDRQYDCYRVQLANRINNTILRIYSDSGRTNEVAAVDYASSGFSNIDEIDGGFYYYNISDGDDVSYDDSFTVYNGWTYTFTGNYTPEEPRERECRSFEDGEPYVRPENEGIGRDCSSKSIGFCFGSYTVCTFQGTLGDGTVTWLCRDYTCERVTVKDRVPSSLTNVSVSRN